MRLRADESRVRAAGYLPIRRTPDSSPLVVLLNAGLVLTSAGALPPDNGLPLPQGLKGFVAKGSHYDPAKKQLTVTVDGSLAPIHGLAGRPSVDDHGGLAGKQLSVDVANQVIRDEELKVCK